MLGVYSLFERLTSAFPEILFESCSSGGRPASIPACFFTRRRAGSATTRTPSSVFAFSGAPLSAIRLRRWGAHVSASPNHQVGPRHSDRHTARPSRFSAPSATSSIPPAFRRCEREAIKIQIAFFKQHRTLFRTGRFIRLVSPYEGTDACWMVVSPDRSRAIVAFYRVLAKPFPRRRAHSARRSSTRWRAIA